MGDNWLPRIELKFSANMFTSRIGGVSDLKPLAQFFGYFVKKWGLPTCERCWVVEKVSFKESRWYLIRSVLRYLYNSHIIWILAEATWLSEHLHTFIQNTYRFCVHIQKVGWFFWIWEPWSFAGKVKAYQKIFQ